MTPPGILIVFGYDDAVTAYLVGRADISPAEPTASICSAAWTVRKRPEKAFCSYTGRTISHIVVRFAQLDALTLMMMVGEPVASRKKPR
ncbi:hypothetical protein ACVWZA_001725 [Sphingomonas sp. UYAg733]